MKEGNWIYVHSEGKLPSAQTELPAAMGVQSASWQAATGPRASEML